MRLLSPPLQAFLQVSTLKTVHGAAKALGLTQTGVTQRIRALESQLGVTLFTRSRKGMMLTREGESLARYCQAALELEGQVSAQLQGAARETEASVRITGPTSMMRTRVVPGCTAVLKNFPSLLLDFAINDLQTGIEDLKSGKTHIALVAPEQVPRELDSKLLKPERYLLVGSHAWKKRKTADIVQQERIIDFDPSDRMSHDYLRKFGLLKLAKTGRHFVNNNEALCSMFVQGLGYGVLTEEFARPWLETGKLIALNEGRALENKLALAWYPRAGMPTYFRALIQAIR